MLDFVNKRFLLINEKTNYYLSRKRRRNLEVVDEKKKENLTRHVWKEIY
jgi:hypothetical protein